MEQHLHNIDVINWFTGGRQRHISGDQFDFFSVQFECEKNVHVHSICHQIDGCVSNVSELVMGTKGYSNPRNKIFKHDSSLLWEYKAGNAKKISPKTGITSTWSRPSAPTSSSTRRRTRPSPPWPPSWGASQPTRTNR